MSIQNSASTILAAGNKAMAQHILLALHERIDDLGLSKNGGINFSMPYDIMAYGHTSFSETGRRAKSFVYKIIDCEVLGQSDASLTRIKLQQNLLSQDDAVGMNGFAGLLGFEGNDSGKHSFSDYENQHPNKSESSMHHFISHGKTVGVLTFQVCTEALLNKLGIRHTACLALRNARTETTTALGVRVN